MPKLGEGRVRALDVYARTEEPGTGPRIAIVVTGLGVGQAATAGATARLPAAVSLAFLPYGGEAERAAARARDAGHEVFLQLPMEPFDYPDSDPGPQTLLTALKGPENADRLAWALARFPGYVGVANFMGSKLMADPAFEPVLREIGARGLGFLDDGTAPKTAAAPAQQGQDPDRPGRDRPRRHPARRSHRRGPGPGRGPGAGQRLRPRLGQRRRRSASTGSRAGPRSSTPADLHLVPASVALRGSRDKRVSTAD